MALKGRALPGPVEGHPRFCRRCGHDLVGLSGHDCPRCGRAFPPLTGRRRHTPAGRSPAGNNGKWLVVGVVAVGLVLAAVGLKYRKFDPRPTPLPAADPTTAPAATHPSQATVPTQPVSRTRALNRLETV